MMKWNAKIRYPPKKTTTLRQILIYQTPQDLYGRIIASGITTLDNPNDLVEVVADWDGRLFYMVWMYRVQPSFQW